MRLVLLVLLGVSCSDYGLTARGQGEGDPAADVPVVDGGTEQVLPLDTASPDTGTPADDTEAPEDSGEPAGPEAGCADGEREGFQSWDDYPDIAACSGAWSVGGVTRDDLEPTCGRASGDDGANVEGSGCSAADLCAEGWHVCDGHTEVEDLAGSCDAAVPDGTPDKSLFFAVSQHSVENTVCDDGASEGNDVFGCGNLGTSLGSEKGCGVLNRALASMHAGSCGFNEAEPSLGPWECEGDEDSHYAEGTLVTKDGCPGGSCSYDGLPIDSADKGGVICCRD